jgi:hypothetical protein
LAAVLLAASVAARLNAQPDISTAAVAESTATPHFEAAAASVTIRGVHMTGWAAGLPRTRRSLISSAKGAGLNAVVVALKEYDGRMFVKGVPLAREIGAYVNAIPDLASAVDDFKQAGLYTVGRIVLFKDDTLARRRPELAVHRPDGSVWATYNGAAWVDPYQKKVWEYNVDIASQAAAAGFDEIQFDYIRFPTEGDLKACRFARQDRTKKTDAQDLVDFLAYARGRLKPLGVKLSIAIFGLTTTDDTGMGIGQHLEGMSEQVDYVSPMMYPSHYHKGEYGIPNPNREPYKTIHLGLRDATERLGSDIWRLRPYFQDFSLGFHYGPKQVRDQIFAAARMGVTNWVLWNPQNRYTWAAIPSSAEIEAVAKEKVQEDAKDAKETNEKP